MYLSNDTRFQYFLFNNRAYRTGTIVKLDSTYTNTHAYNNSKIWTYARFSHRIVTDNATRYMFFSYNAEKNITTDNYCGYFTIDECDMRYAISEIIKPIEVALVKRIKKKDCESKEVMVGWIIYILVLFASFIFYEWYFAWLYSSIVFFVWRNKKLWE